MPRNVDHFQELNDALSRLSTTAEKSAKVISYLSELYPEPGPAAIHNAAGGNMNVEVRLPPDAPFSGPQLYELISRHGISAADLFRATPPRAEFALQKIPCAYFHPQTREECPRDGTAACTACKLVSYCSKDCQRKHWRIHKEDCRSSVRSVEWQPAWVEENRVPTFIAGNPRLSPLSKGIALWGNVPAMDILGTCSKAQEAYRKPLNLAFAASGDLRNVIRTVNGLPNGYEGKLTILLNDLDTFVSVRNVLLLKMLGTVANKRKAADIALHLWYSAFIPHEYRMELNTHLVELINDQGTWSIKLGGKAKLEVDNDDDMAMWCRGLAVSSEMYTLSDAADELAGIRFNPSRTDLRHRQMLPMEPSHRLAFLEYLRFGLVLPFGAHNAYFNVPNPLLFSPTGQWLQTDHANPLDSWDIEDIVKSGSTHGATRADLYGCLYFHLSDQLYEFANRLSRLDISFKVFRRDVLELPTAITQGKLARFGIPSSMRFDRIDVSNVVDADYAGIAPVINAWGGHLKRDPNSTLIAYFMNWPGRQAGAEPEPGLCDVEELMSRVTALGRVSTPFPERLKASLGTGASKEKIFSIFTSFIANLKGPLVSLYDNSAAFETYLTKYGIDAALARHKLHRRIKHKIIPHRLCAPQDGLPSALPEFKDEESWYLQSTIGRATWTERFIEICPTSV